VRVCVRFVSLSHRPDNLVRFSLSFADGAPTTEGRGGLQVHAPPRFSLRKAAAVVAAPPPLTRDAAADSRRRRL